MEKLWQTLSALLDSLFFGIISPAFVLLGQGLELFLLRPLQLLQVPSALQVLWIGIVAAALSLVLRRLMRAEEKDAAFRSAFLAKKGQQDDLHLISDWKSREKFAKAIDDDIDEDFNSYLAGRFARYGIIYLLPIFFTLYWLGNTILDGPFLIVFPSEPYGIQGLSLNFIFLFSYCLSLFIYFKLGRKLLRKKENIPLAGKDSC